ncbi:hypothetical protein AXX17_AT4G21650 [Arabidopsis thaliana]|uniref:Uncharacterized protein n=1 Tax=Arabidopsis thaliana TaxID=3702 RepID=A0A178UYW7_ARATH|nr:hypothetical protein AXX17_AT4G21650 [Arabidopsis thaliana]
MMVEDRTSTRIGPRRYFSRQNWELLQIALGRLLHSTRGSRSAPRHSYGGKKHSRD